MRIPTRFISRLQNDRGEFIYQFSSSYKIDLDNKPYNLDIKEVKSLKSLQQNKMLWANIKQIAQYQNEDYIKVYCDVLTMAQVKSETFVLPCEITQEMRKCFRAVKFVSIETVLDIETGITKDMYHYECFIGTSKFNKEEMNRLIEITLNIKADLGIYDTVDAETMLSIYGG